MKLFGSLSAITFSPIVTIEPRRRKFHCPIKLKIPLPPGYRPESSANLRLLCSITGGQSKAIWEDVTSSTPLTLTDKCLLFTTTVSARFWLVHCQRAQRCQDAARFAQELWRYLIQVPFMAKFVVFAKRRDINEASVRVFSMTDDKEEKTLEVQEHYTLVARSRDVEVLDGQVLYLEFGGNLIPTHLVAKARGGSRSGSQAASAPGASGSGALINEQLAFAFYAFQENRLAFGVRLREVGQEPSGRIAFMEDSIKYLASLNQQQRAYLNERRRRAVCTLGVQLPAMCVHYDSILGTPKRNSYYATARIGDLSLADIAAELNVSRLPPSASGDSQRAAPGAWSPDSRAELEDSLNQFSESDNYKLGVSNASLLSADTSSLIGASQSARRRPDWMKLAPKLGIPRDEVEFIADHCGQAESDQGGGVAPALLLLMHWYRLSSPDDRDQDLARGLLAIGREDIAQRLNFPIEPKRISRSTMELLREIEMIPVRSTENLYGSELSSGYTMSRAAPGVASQGSSLRRLDQNSAGLGGASFEEERRRQRARTASASSAPASRQERQRSQEYGGQFDAAAADRGGSSSGGGGTRKVPAIEVSQAERSVKRNKMEGGDLATSAIVTPTTVAQLVTSQQSSTSSTVPVTTSGGATGQPTFGQQQLIRQQVSMIESLAHNLADEALNEALEAYLMRQVQETAEETMRAAFAAATGGATVKRQDDGGEPSSESGASLSTRGDRRAASQGMADDEMSYGEDDDYGDDDDDGDDDTLNAHLQTIDHNNTVSRQTSASELSASDDPLRKSSTSPSRLDGRDIFQDLSEMANYADRIDSILEQSASEHSTRSGSHLGGPSSSGGVGGGAWPNARRPRSVSPFLGNDNYRAAGVGPDGGDDDLDDENEELD